MPGGDPDRVELLQGTLDLIVLRALDTMGPQHAYALAARLEQVARPSLTLNQGTLYPALVRLEQEGFIKSKWGASENGRRARFYSLTAKGRRQLDDDHKIERHIYVDAAGPRIGRRLQRQWKSRCR